MGTQKYFYSPYVNVVSQGGTQEGNPSSATCNLGVHRFGGPVVTTHKGQGGAGGALQISVLQHNIVPVMTLLLCILKASNAVPNRDLLYLAPTTQ